jgi:uncharacterized protein (TIGR02246 family)
MASRSSARPSRFALAIGFLTLAAACAQQAPDTRAEDEAAIRKADATFAAAALAKNLDSFVSFYADEAAVLPPNEPLITGRDNIRKVFTELMATPEFSISWQPSKVDVARSADLGYSIGSYHMTLHGPDGKPTMDMGKYATVWKKQTDGSWKVVVDMFNSDAPIPAPPPVKSK